MGVNEEDYLTKEENDEEEEVPLPGFRFHPTDEELVSFYLRRKLDNKPLTIQLIKQIDIYKYDPWDLPKASCGGGEKEGYFFCKRGRKYRNSIRPNRVTGSGFWKATGIDKPVYSHGGEGNDCIGLKKTLVYYRGSAGKGTKTDWMMHEFRLPSNVDTTNFPTNAKNFTDIAQEAEIWTLCRIFKRNVTQRKHTAELRQISSKRHSIINEKSNKMMSNTMDFNTTTTNQEAYINFGASNNNGHYYHNNDQKPVINYTISGDQRNNQLSTPMVMAQQQQQTQLMSSTPIISSNWINQAANDLLSFENWDELGSVVKFAVDSPSF